MDHSDLLSQLVVRQRSIFCQLHIFCPGLFDQLFQPLFLLSSLLLSLHLLQFAHLLLSRRLNRLILIPHGKRGCVRLLAS